MAVWYFFPGATRGTAAENPKRQFFLIDCNTKINSDWTTVAWQHNDKVPGKTFLKWWMSLFYLLEKQVNWMNGPDLGF